MTFKKTAGLILFLSLLSLGWDWRPARPDYSWSFPRDHWARKAYRNEWWYFTGHLHSTLNPQRRFGFQFTFFRIGLTPDPPRLNSAWAARDMIMGHAALTDLSTRKHLFSEVLYRAAPLLGGFGAFPDPTIAWSRAPAGSTGKWLLKWNGRGFDFSMRDDRQGTAFSLATVPQKPLVLEGPNGFSPKAQSASAASLYYSFTRLKTTGRLQVQGKQYEVEGSAWMDKEFSSNVLQPKQVGWDWFSLQLDDKREVMLYRLRDPKGRTSFARGTLIAPDGSVVYLEPGDWELHSEDSWTSPRSGIRYPSGWNLTLKEAAIKLRLVPRLKDQENRSRLVSGLNYWEGSVQLFSAPGRPSGLGYVELTGYGKGSRPPL